MARRHDPHPDEAKRAHRTPGPPIPPPRAHQVRYHGILAPGAKQRDQIVPGEVVARCADGTKGRVGDRNPPAAEESRGASPAPGMPSGMRGQAASFENPADDSELDRANAEPRSHVDPCESARRMRWASLLQRVFEVDALRCPRCGSSLRLIAAIEDSTVARKILECLGLPARAPPLVPAAAEAPDLGPDEDGWFFDQSPAQDDPDPLVSAS